MISKKMKYAIKALVYIAQNSKENSSVKTNDIASKAIIPKKFLEQILLELKKNRIVNSRQGSMGGYYLMKKPNEITLAAIYRLCEGPIALVSCASLNYYEPCSDCVDEATCKIKFALIDIRQKTIANFESITIATLI